jgi:cytochrome c-type biogenesis protein
MSAFSIGNVFLQHKKTVEIISALVLLFFGLYLTGVINFRFLSYRFSGNTGKFKPGIVGAFFMGLVFAAGWTPCVGPILAGILAVCAKAQTANRGLLLLVSYCLGLGIPFILIGFGTKKAVLALKKYQNVVKYSQKIAGLILILLSISILL